MVSTELKLLECGSLPKPGPIGRLVRLAFGILSLYYILGLWIIRYDLLAETGSIQSLVWNGILPTLFLISYVVNIGFSRAWKKWPAFVGLGIAIIAGMYGYMQTGHYETLVLAQTLWALEFYVFTHIGLSFVLAAMLATPGCEMRAAHNFYSKLSGIPTKEHHCPVGPLNNIDKWEHARISK